MVSDDICSTSTDKQPRFPTFSRVIGVSKVSEAPWLYTFINLVQSTLSLFKDTAGYWNAVRSLLSALQFSISFLALELSNVCFNFGLGFFPTYWSIIMCCALRVFSVPLVLLKIRNREKFMKRTRVIAKTCVFDPLKANIGKLSTMFWTHLPLLICTFHTLSLGLDPCFSTLCAYLPNSVKSSLHRIVWDWTVIVAESTFLNPYGHILTSFEHGRKSLQSALFAISWPGEYGTETRGLVALATRPGDIYGLGIGFRWS